MEILCPTLVKSYSCILSIWCLCCAVSSVMNEGLMSTIIQAENNGKLANKQLIRQTCL